MNLKYTFHTSCKVTCRIFCCKLSKFLFYNSATSTFDCPLLQILQIAVQGKIFATWHLGQLFFVANCRSGSPKQFFSNWCSSICLKIAVVDNFFLKIFCQLTFRTIWCTFCKLLFWTPFSPQIVAPDKFLSNCDNFCCSWLLWVNFHFGNFFWKLLIQTKR